MKILAFILASFSPLALASVKVSSDFWDFGYVAENNTQAKTFTITNDSWRSVSMGNVSIDNPAFTTDSHPCPAYLLPGQDCKITVKYQPSVDDLYVGEMRIAYGKTRNALVTLAGRSSKFLSPPYLYFSPDYWDFGNASTPKRHIRTFSISAMDDIYISAIAIESSQETSDYSIVRNKCPIVPTPLKAGTPCEVTVKFHRNLRSQKKISGAHLEVTFQDRASESVIKDSVSMIGRE